jgi:hypothetical protein
MLCTLGRQRRPRFWTRFTGGAGHCPRWRRFRRLECGESHGAWHDGADQFPLSDGGRNGVASSATDLDDGQCGMRKSPEVLGVSRLVVGAGSDDDVVATFGQRFQQLIDPTGFEVDDFGVEAVSGWHHLQCL